MRRIQTKLIFFLVVTVITSSFFATILSAAVSGILAANEISSYLLLGLAGKEILTPVFTVLITAMIITTIAKKAVLPVVELSKATKQIALGNFDVTITGAGRKDEFGQLSRDFMVMAQELKVNEYLAKDFISNLSHEFRTPCPLSRAIPSCWTAMKSRKRNATIMP